MMTNSLKLTTKLFISLVILFMGSKSFCQTTGDEIIGTWMGLVKTNTWTRKN